MSDKEIMEFLAKKFVENCGISAGARTLYWDMAYAFWEERGLSMEDFEKIIAQIEASALEYDVIILQPKDYQRIMQEELEFSIEEEEKEIFLYCWELLKKKIF